ncbi:MAG: SOS response-associated peptidase [Actinomycetota bacterium]|nr:SOS response-associated peptidase [Actinomycetota bacterium]
MCGRFVSSSPPEDLAAYFGAEQTTNDHTEPNFNVAPTTDVLVVVGAEDRRLESFHWGLVPIWAKDPSVGNRMINARAETVRSKNAFKRSYAKRRCLIPADGFYEWTKVAGHRKKQPWFIHHRDDEPFAFAGLWDLWRGPDRDGSQELRSCTILTGSPNEAMARIHDRMPVMLPPSAWERWLDPDFGDLDALDALMVPAPADLLVIEPVSIDVGNVRNKGSYLIEPIEGIDPDGTGEPLTVDEALEERDRST